LPPRHYRKKILSQEINKMKIDQILMSVSDGVVIFNLFVEVFFRTHEHGYTKFLSHILFCKQTKSK
jgi:hypothetical protein